MRESFINTEQADSTMERGSQNLGITEVYFKQDAGYAIRRASLAGVKTVRMSTEPAKMPDTTWGNQTSGGALCETGNCYW